MNDEIKEILDRLDYNEWEVDLYKVPITWCELYDIRDYITNLQQEINKLTAESTEWESKCYDLQQENEKLKEYYDLMVQFNQKNLDRFCDYKSRCEKASEYINKQDMSYYGEVVETKMGIILSILQNGDNKDDR